MLAVTILIFVTSCMSAGNDSGELYVPIRSGIVQPNHPSYNHSMFISENGELWGWGDNAYGQLGNGNTENQHTPVRIMENVATVISEQRKTVALKTNGELWTLGTHYTAIADEIMYFYNDNIINLTALQLGIDRTMILDRVIYFDVNVFNIAAIQNCGTLWVWGDNSFGQIGNGSTEASHLPLKIMENVSIVSLRGFNITAMQDCGTLWTWGRNQYGQLGNGMTENSAYPVKVLENVSRFYNAGFTQAAIKNDGTLWTWGANHLGELGDGTREDSNHPVAILDAVSDVAIISNRVFALRGDGELWGWGWNLNGAVGSGVEEEVQLVPAKIMGNIKSIATATSYVMAITNDNVLWGWGWGVPLCDEVTDIHPIPVEIKRNASQVVSWDTHVLVLDSDAVLWSWGFNSLGKLGVGTFEMFHAREPLTITLK